MKPAEMEITVTKQDDVYCLALEAELSDFC
jgi:hypothetical protein